MVRLSKRNVAIKYNVLLVFELDLDLSKKLSNQAEINPDT
jgi:hypothetical protein